MTFDEWLIGRLIAHGVYDGKGDGAHGRAVIAALETFQKQRHLPVTGRADQATVNALRVDTLLDSGFMKVTGAPAIPAEPVWLREARRFSGLKEIAGPKSNPTILGWAKRFGGWIASFYSNDDIPWCGLFVGHVIAATLPHEKLPANPLGALNWADFGFSPPAVALGAILVFKRNGGGHVGFYAGEDATHFHVLGGNQDNQVKVSRIPKERLVAVRWPKTGDARQGGAVKVSASGAAVSQTES